MSRTFKSPFKAYETIVNEAVENGIPKRTIALSTNQYAQQISDTMRYKIAKFDTLKKVADFLGYDTKIILTKKK